MSFSSFVLTVISVDSSCKYFVKDNSINLIIGFLWILILLILSRVKRSDTQWYADDNAVIRSDTQWYVDDNAVIRRPFLTTIE